MRPKPVATPTGPETSAVATIGSILLGTGDEKGDYLIKYLPALVIVIMFASVVASVYLLRKDSRPAPAPPIVLMQAEAGKVERETLPADALFDFDKSILKPDAGDRIRKFAVRAKEIEATQVIVIGHADPLGTERHNDALSTARAGAVRDALVGEGIDRARVVAIGVGARIPLKKREECPGSRRDPKVVACLEPNRRVEVWAKTLEVQEPSREKSGEKIGPQGK